MKRISIQDLKATLSSAIAETESGTTLLITRHNEPVAQLGPVRPSHLRKATIDGLGPLEPALGRGTKGRYLAVLLEDRGMR